MKQLSDVSNLPASTKTHEVGYYLDSNANYVATWVGTNQCIIVLGNTFRRITGIQRDVTAGRFESTVETLEALGFVPFQRRRIYGITDHVSPLVIELMTLRAAYRLGLTDNDTESFIAGALTDAIAGYVDSSKVVSLDDYFKFVASRRIMESVQALDVLPYDWQAYARFQVSQMFG
jgi:hypothetical protein